MKKILIDLVSLMSVAMDNKDQYTSQHCKSVVDYSLALGNELNLSKSDIDDLKIGSQLHDIGKIVIPNDIINKPSSLTDKEFIVIQSHPVLGGEIVKHITEDDNIIACTKSHHERWDGKGYPDKLVGENIPFFARIVSIADTYHAMTSDRSYRKALSKEVAISELLKNRGTQFDPQLVDVFIQTLYKEACGI